MNNPKFKVILTETKEVIGYANDICDLERLVFWSGYYLNELNTVFGSIYDNGNYLILSTDTIEEDLPYGSYLEKYDNATYLWVIATDQAQKERFGYDDDGEFYQDLATMEIIELY